ncbi:replication initiator [Streptomyces alkaliphilus]|uniref:replication initiator n=1 Tax=Streptomyces alkaliphilus TaxID=1472722 RepID=UPI001E62D113|nr:replication initiator [Streptomyces alkaliphilus]
MDRLTAIGGCSHPIHLSGSTTVLDPSNGEILHRFDTSGEPGERLSLRCGNRRASVCPSCSRLHAGDTYHLVRAGLLGGRNVPFDVRDRPRLFVTLTAPGFGAVHRAGNGARCRPRSRVPDCGHGRPVGCPLVHEPTDPLVGQPLCPGCYDYPGHVLWHALAGRLWKAFTDNLHHHLAARTGRTRTGFRRSVRISYAKVAEYQRRAAVHVHAVVRLDGPEGPGDPPPGWVSGDLLADAVRTAAGAVSLASPDSPALGERRLRWGAQLDVRPLTADRGPDGLTEEGVAAYVAKYVTKGAAESGAGLDRRLTDAGEIATARVTPHVRALMACCWRLGGLPELRHLRLREWAHSLGFRGRLLTTSRRYSTTYGALREERAEHERERNGPDLPDGIEPVTESSWRYVGSGHSPGAALLAAGIAEDLARNREAARDASTHGGGAGGG